jgi:hypothetical protein
MRYINPHSNICGSRAELVKTDNGYVYKMGSREYKITNEDLVYLIPELPGADRYLANILDVTVSCAKDILDHLRAAEAI